MAAASDDNLKTESLDEDIQEVSRFLPLTEDVQDITHSDFIETMDTVGAETSSHILMTEESIESQQPEKLQSEIKMSSYLSISVPAGSEIKSSVDKLSASRKSLQKIRSDIETQELINDQIIEKEIYSSIPAEINSGHDGTHKRAAEGGPTGAHAGGSSFVFLGHHDKPPPAFHIIDFPVKVTNPRKTPNYIRTTKYTLLTFIPLNLYFQFSRVYNIYFLLGALSTLGGTSSVSSSSMIAPLIIVLIFSAIKDAYEDYKRYQSDYSANNAKFQVIRNGKSEELLSMNIHPGDFIFLKKGEKSPVDSVIISSSFEDGTCFIDTAELDGETNLKRRSAVMSLSSNNTIQKVSLLDGKIECEHPNENLHKFTGRISTKLDNNESTKSLNMDNLILRGAVLRNTDYLFGIVVYTGLDTKIIRNLKPAKLKSSKLEKQLNYFVIAAFVYNAFLLISSVVIEYVEYSRIFDLQKSRKSQFPNDFAIQWYLGPVEASSSTHLKNSILSYFALYSFVIPISLFVTMEVVRLAQGSFMFWDEKLKTVLKTEDQPDVIINMKANNTNLNEELAEIEYIFSDKTGTFTKNEMKLAKWFVEDKLYDDMSDPGSLGRDLSDKSTLSPKSKVRLSEFSRCLALCHGVIPAEDQKLKKIIYESQSPDETALLNAVRLNNVVLFSRNKSEITINFVGKLEKYEILAVLDFNSTRKRMSIILKNNDGIILYCKGADNVIEARLSPEIAANPPEILELAAKRLNDLSEVGLRTLMVASKKIKEDDYLKFRKLLDDAENSLDDREEKVMKVYESIETNLVYLGCTAIEDRLQDELPETIEYLLKTGIKIWLLTGDKQGTAINIGMASRLINSSMHLLVLEAKDPQECTANLREMIKEIKDQEAGTEFALVVSGEVLTQVFSAGSQKDLFLEVGCQCHSVICARVSPLQKALVVKLVKDSMNVRTLAIGDGANDVSMIQAAHVGVGIAGREGTQAVRASDFSFGEFRHLRRLLSVHGRYNYLRLSSLIYFSFYKNLMFITVQWWFGFVSNWSGQTAYEEVFFTAYNVVFTSLPPLFLGIFEKDVGEKYIEKYPQLFNQVRKGIFWNWRLHCTMLFSSIWHSLLIFGAIYFVNYEGTVDSLGKSTGYWVQCYLFSTPLLITVLLKHSLMTKHWIWITWTVIAVSLAFNLIVMFFVQVLMPSFIYSDAWTSIITHLTSSYYVLSLLVPVLCILPDIFAMYFNKRIWPSDADIIMEEEVLQNRMSSSDGKRVAEETNVEMRSIR